MFVKSVFFLALVCIDERHLSLKQIFDSQGFTCIGNPIFWEILLGVATQVELFGAKFISLLGLNNLFVLLVDDPRPEFDIFIFFVIRVSK